VSRISRLRRSENIAHEETREGYTILIMHDPDGFGCNPRDNDGNAVMITWERDYNSPDSNDYGWGKGDDYGAYDFLAWVKERKAERHSADPGLVYAWLDRNGYDGSISIVDIDEDNDRDLRRPDGVIYATYDTIREWHGVKKLTAEHKRKAQEGLRPEVQEYSDWAIGNIYGYVVTDDSDTIHDDCWGYIGDYDEGYGALSKARSTVDYRIANGKQPAPSDEACEADAEEEIAEYAAHMTDPRASITHPDAAAYALTLGPQ
jgi:hypothetical protein